MDSECLLISKIHKKTFQYCSILQSKDQRDFTSGQLFSIPIVYEIERGNNELMVKLNMPEKAELLTRTFAFFSPPQIPSTDEIINDYSNIFSNTMKMELKFTALVKGDTNANLKPESALANFVRLLGRHSNRKSDQNIDDPMQGNIFSYLVGKDRVPLKISVFPYRDGSKIVYEADIPYFILADGSNVGYDLPEKLKLDIDKIIND